MISTNIRFEELVREEEGRFWVHRDVYVDPEIFQLEMERIFESSWLYLAHESQVANPGDYLTLLMGRQPVILYRDRAGKLRVFVNRCRHRGAMLLCAQRGNTPYFRCPYHGWTYSDEGVLVGIPDRGGYPPGIEGGLSLEEIPCVETYRGFIFGRLRADGPSLQEHLGNARPYLDLIFEKYAEGVAFCRGVVRYAYRGNWKLQVENALDFYHVPFTHRSFIEVAKARGLTVASKVESPQAMARDEAIYLGRGHAVTITWAYGEATSPGIAGIAGPDELGRRVGPRLAKWAGRFAMHLLIFPNVMFMEEPGLQIRIVRPRAVDYTEIIAYHYIPRGIPKTAQERILRVGERFLGPAGIGTPDDLEMFHRCMQGYWARTAPWNDLSRGILRERCQGELEEVGPFEAVGNITDDTHYRGLYRWWLRLMQGEVR
jgi:benzoate/toluate 1,2-dioxygenase alpha subunit